MAFALAACCDGTTKEAKESAFITISLGRDTSREAVPWNQDVDDGNVLHDIFIDGNKVGEGIKIGDGVKTYPAIPGSHKVSVNVYYPAGTLFSYGEKTVTVIAGQRAKCDITIKAPSATEPGETMTPTALTLEPGNTKITYTWTASVPAADSYDLYWKAGSVLNTADVKTGIKITGAASGGTITGLTNGTAYSVVVTANKSGYPSVDSDVESATPSLVYHINGSGTAFTATKDGATVGTANQPINTVIDDVRGDANGDKCIIQFGDGKHKRRRQYVLREQ